LQVLDRQGGALWGGDTTAHDGALVVSLTAIGEVPSSRAIKRSGAKEGDLVFVTGTIGDATLGLDLLKNPSKNMFITPQHAKLLTSRYHLPEARLFVGQLLREVAHACVDVSDGLIADLAHIAKASHCSIVVEAERVPLSAAAKEALKSGMCNLESLLTGGDDYELAYTIPPEKVSILKSSLDKHNEMVTQIGFVLKGEGVSVTHLKSPLFLNKTGYQHF
jgi:thiamine-monophosphate kinase